MFSTGILCELRWIFLANTVSLKGIATKEKINIYVISTPSLMIPFAKLFEKVHFLIQHDLKWLFSAGNNKKSTFQQRSTRGANFSDYVIFVSRNVGVSKSQPQRLFKKLSSGIIILLGMYIVFFSLELWIRFGMRWSAFRFFALHIQKMKKYRSRALENPREGIQLLCFS